jgi:hypothetical protein
MNAFVAARYDETVHRLALGIEPIDAARDQVLLTPVMLTFDDLLLGSVRPTLARHPSNRHVLLYDEHYSSQARTVDLRIFDQRERLHGGNVRSSVARPQPGRLYDSEADGRRFVPRRLRIRLRNLTDAEAAPAEDRICRPRVFPGPAYSMNQVATGLRGHAMREAAAPLPLRPLRWARVLATVPSAQAELAQSTVVGSAHGDDRGEFVLLIRYHVAAIGIDPELSVRLRVFAGAEAAPPSPELPVLDPLWDLPREEPASLAETDTVLRGEAIPPGYGEVASRVVALPLGRMLRGQPNVIV